jgi:hypothetical protein
MIYAGIEVICWGRWHKSMQLYKLDVMGWDVNDIYSNLIIRKDE